MVVSVGLKDTSNVVDFAKDVLDNPKLLETMIRGKLGSRFTGVTNNLRNVSFKFNKLNGTVEAGLEMDLEFTYDGITYTYKGRDQFKATKAGKPAGDGSESDKDLKGDSIEMVASDLIAAYAKAIGASSSEISRLIDNTEGEFDNGSIVFESSTPEPVVEMIRHEGDKWKVYTKDGKKLLGTHDTEKEAQAQLAAIEISKKG